MDAPPQEYLSHLTAQLHKPKPIPFIRTIESYKDFHYDPLHLNLRKSMLSSFISIIRAALNKLSYNQPSYTTNHSDD